MHNFSRREFLKWIRCSSAGLLTCGAALPKLFGEQQGPRNPIPRPIPIPQIIPQQPIQVVGLARNSFNMITLGDSLMWGQGLPDNPRTLPNSVSFKFRDKVQDWLQAQFGSSRTVKQWSTHAHSGAQIQVNNGEPDTDPNLSGEIPMDYPSVKLQAQLTATDLINAGVRLNDVDLVLVDGGINDLNIRNILSPFNGPDDIRKLADQYCVNRMSQLLPFLIGLFSNAAIVVTGYFPIASDQSDLSLLLAMGAALSVNGVVGGAAGAVAGLLTKHRMVENSFAWNDEAQTGLSNLVNQTNSSGNPFVALAWPNFQPENSYAAPNTFLFTARQFGDDEDAGVANVLPEAPTSLNGVAWTRARACMATRNVGPLCFDASIGHPNPAGAQAFADAITGQLQTTVRAKLGLPAPVPLKNMNVRIVQSGTEKLPSRAHNTTLLTWNWLVISATDSQTGAPVPGVSAFVNSPGGQQLGPANLPYQWYSGSAGQRIFYICSSATAVPPAILPGTQAPVGVRPHPMTIPCMLGVTAPGYNSQRLTPPS
jgi:lysophospholipase L1-like esterase